MVCSSTHPMRTTLRRRRRGLLPSLRRVFLGNWTAFAVAVLALGTGRAARAQTPTPTPEPPRLLQDELDLQANSNVVQGSGARAFGMGGAFLARADDATAASWNPAGLSYLRAPELSVVWADSSLGNRKIDASGLLVENDQRSGNAPDFLAATFPIELGSVNGAAQLSYQRIISFNAERTITEPDRIRIVQSDGGFDVLTFGSGWQLSRRFRAGLTVNRWLNGYRQTIERPAPRTVPTRQNSNFTFSGWNVQVGAIWSPRENLNLGAVIKTGFSGNVKLARSRVDLFTAADGTTIPTSNAYSRPDLVLNFPGAAGFGVSWRPRSNLTISLDYTRTFWSKGRINNFFTLPATLPDDQAPPVPTFPTDFFPLLPYPTLNDFGQKDTEQVRTGVEYVIISRRLKLPLRAGYFSDGQYFRDASGHAPRFTGLTGGAGIILGSFLLDVAYVSEHGSYTDFDLNHNSIRSHRFFASLIYRHRRRP